MKIYKIKVNGKTYKVELEAVEEVAGSVPGKIENSDKKATETVVPSGEGQTVVSPIQGVVNSVKVAVGDKVKKGQVIAIIEAMKLENEVVSTFDGVVAQVLISKGQSVTAKAGLIVVK